MNQINTSNLFVKNALEYYDSHQPEIQKILNKTHYIKLIDNKNLTDEIIFYDSDKNILLKSKFEYLSMYEPRNKIWKWSWAVVSFKPKYTFISRKILNYAFTLDHNNNINYQLKNTLVYSKISIETKINIDILLSTSAYLCKKPFIFKFYFPGPGPIGKMFNYKDIINDPNKKEFIVFYLIILDWNI